MPESVDNRNMSLKEAEGCFSKIKFKSGISAAIMDYSLFKPITSKVGTSNPAFGFGFCLSGKTRAGISCLKNELIIQGGQSAFYYFPEIRVKSEISSEEDVKRVSINIPPEIFLEFIDEEPDAMPLNILNLLSHKSPEPFRAADKLTPGMRRLLMQILNCGYKGLPKRFFIEAKIMELVACKLDTMIKNQRKPKKAVTLKKDDIERLYFARDLLKNNIEKPPELLELSRMVGISRTKLLNGFFSLFGTSPTSYLRDMRIEKARILLDQGHMSLTDIAHLVGYSSSSHFTKVFKNYFGVTPSQYTSVHKI